MYTNQVSLLIALLILVGFLSLAVSEKGYAGILPGGPPCCDFPEASECIGGEGAVSACQGGNCLGAPPCHFFEDAACVATRGDEGRCLPQENIPTFNQWGLVGLAVALGVVGIVVYLRRKSAFGA